MARQHKHKYRRVQQNKVRMRICKCGAWLLVVRRSVGENDG